MQTKDVLAEVERELAHVKDELDDRNAAYEELQRSAEERRELLTQKEAALQTTQGRLNELRQQFNAQRIAADEKVWRYHDLRVYRLTGAIHRRSSYARSWTLRHRNTGSTRTYTKR